MKILDKTKLALYVQQHSTARSSFQTFTTALEGCTARNYTQLRETFGSVTAVPNRQEGTRYVFNVGGNDHRVIAEIDFREQVAFIVEALSHDDYNKWSDRQRKKRK